MRTAQAAESLYGFFAPPDFAESVLKKYWGAVYFLIQEDTSSVKGFCDQLIDLSMRIKPIKLLFSRIGLIKPPTDKSSHPLERAWMHLLMALIYVKRKPRRSRQHMDTCLGLLDLGITGVKDTFPKPVPQKPKVILPLDVATLIGFHLLDKKSPGMNIKLILDKYSKYLSGLTQIKFIQERLADKREVLGALAVPTANTKSEIQREPQERKLLGDHAAHTLSKPGESGAVSETDDGSNSYSSGQQTPNSSLISLRSSFSKGCQDLIDQTAEGFSELMSQACTLEEMNEKKIQHDKSRQDFAIYAFTIVTIIFLPLNTVSSIFGMNTSDIRDIESGQWIYWAVAIPLTVIVMALTLFWAGELNIVYNLVKSFPRRRNVER
ncbi:Nucleic acid-binding OB-fold [Penicillium expansum]|nr:Nucleic acid-binding OB-fold [Penicillium expansum]